MAAHHLPQNIYYLNKTIYNLYRICYPVSWHKNRITKVFHCPNVAIFAIKTRMIVSAVICYIDWDSIVSSTHDILVWSNVLCPITLMWTLISWCVLLIPILVVSNIGCFLIPFREICIFHHIYLVSWHSSNSFFGLLLC